MAKSKLKKNHLCKKHKRQKIYSGRIVKLYLDTFVYPDKSTRTYELVEHAGAVAILPINQKGQLLLIKQYRSALGEILIEVPAGILEKGEKIEMCAQRELQEEIGYAAQKLTFMGTVYSSPGFCNETLHLFLAKNLKKSILKGDEDEEIDIFPVSEAEALKLIGENKIRDLKTIAAIFFYKEWRHEQNS